MIKVTTEHGTEYLIDFDNSRAKRIPNSSNYMLDDEEWFYFSHVHAVDRKTKQHFYKEPFLIGKSMWFDIVQSVHYDWKVTTKVVSIEEYEG